VSASARPPGNLAELVAALRLLPPRQARLISLRLLEGASEEDCASFYGTSREACGVHLLRALDALSQQLSGRSPRSTDLTAAQEASWSAGLERALAIDAPSRSPEPPAHGLAGPPLDQGEGGERLHGLRLLALQLRSQAGPIREALAAAERAEADSPARRRSDALRIVAIVVLIALAVWLGLT